LFAVGMAALMTEDYYKARTVAEFQFDLYTELRDEIGSTLPLIVLGHSALALNEHRQARDYYLRCKKISQATGFLYSFQTSSKYLGKVDLSLRNLDEAEQNLRQCLAGTVEMGFVRDVINIIYEFARLRAVRGICVGAVELLSFVYQHPVSQQTRLLEGRIRDSAEIQLKKLEAGMDKQDYLDAVDRGGKLDLEIILPELLKM
jgi:hypothetical protein